MTSLKEKNLTKRWLDQGIPDLREWVLFSTQHKIFLKWTWPKNGVHPKYNAVIAPPTKYLLTFLLKAIQWLLIPFYSRIKPKFLGKAHKTSMIQCPPGFSGLISYLPSSFLYAGPKAIYMLPKCATYIRIGRDFNLNVPHFVNISAYRKPPSLWVKDYSLSFMLNSILLLRISFSHQTISS